MFVISFNICLFIYFSVKYAIQSNDCDVFVNKQSIYLSLSQNLIKIGQIYITYKFARSGCIPPKIKYEIFFLAHKGSQTTRATPGD